jgi:hypothetical protein
MPDLSGIVGGGTLGQNKAEQERPYLAAKSGRDRAYKAGWLDPAMDVVPSGAGYVTTERGLPGNGPALNAGTAP